MSIRLCLFALLCFSFGTVRAQDRASSFEGIGADGNAVRFDPDHRDKPALLLFWATWCPYCEALMPHLQKVYEAAGAKNLDVYAIDIKEDGDPIATLKKRGQTFTLVLDGDPIAEQYHVKGTPSLFLVDTKGVIVYHPNVSDPATIEGALREKLRLPAVK